MTVYLDTSSMVKLYVAEAGSDIVRRLVAESAVVATSVVAYPEMRATLARLSTAGETVFSSFDDRLNDAARKLKHRLARRVRR